MKYFFSTAVLCVASLFLTGCDDDDSQVIPTSFQVTIENISQPQTVVTDRAMGTVPLSPPAYAVFTGDDPMFEPGDRANEGTARIAEDGFAEAMLAILASDNDVKTSNVATSPGGPDDGPAVFSGESVTFNVSAQPGDKFQFETMFVQSNDWFYAFDDGGLELFDGSTPVAGDVTGRVAIYDAGSEEDTAPGTGPTMLPGPVQKPVQEATASNFGTDEDVDIENARTRHPNFTIPANNTVIRVTVTPQ